MKLAWTVGFLIRVSIVSPFYVFTLLNILNIVDITYDCYVSANRIMKLRFATDCIKYVLLLYIIMCVCVCVFHFLMKL